MVLQDHSSYLLDLVGFGLGALGLEIQDLGYPLFAEDMMTSLDPLVKAQVPKQAAEGFKRDVGVRSSPEIRSRSLFGMVVESPWPAWWRCRGGMMVHQRPSIVERKN
jgi:hypothetical protein